MADVESIFQEQQGTQDLELRRLFAIHNHDGRNSLQVANIGNAANTAVKVRSSTSRIAGETLANGNGVRIGITNNTDDLRAVVSQTMTNESSELFYYYRIAQSFVITGSLNEQLKTVTLKMGGNAIMNWVVDLANDNNGLPGTTIATSGTVNVDASFVERTFTFATPQTLSTSTVYWIVARSTETSGNLYCAIQTNDPYTGGVGKKWTGSAWVDLPNNSDLYFKINCSDTAGRIYKSSATTAALANAYIGVANSAANAGGTVEVIHGGTKIDFTNLTPGATYYVTDTRGSLGTTPGTVTRTAGIALSQSDLLIIL